MKNTNQKNKLTLLFLLVVLFGNFSSFASDKKNELASPNKQVTVRFTISSEKQAFYSVFLNGETVLGNSRLGIVMEDMDFSQNLKLESESATETIRDTYTMLYGKKQNFSYEGNKKVFHLVNQLGEKMDIIFQVSNDGVAFRYYFPEKAEKKEITSELSTFNLVSGTKAWIQPIAEAKSGWASTQPSYEEYYVQDVFVDKLPENKPGWIYPALFNKGENWLLISETASYGDYCATRLLHQSGTNGFTVGFPDAREVFPGGEANPESDLPWYTPWRIIAISKSLAGIVASSLGTDLAKPTVKGDFSFVKPGRSSWSWVLLKDDSTVFDVQKRFVDYAASMSWEYCLVDALWEKQIGKEKIAELAAYAQTKNVGLLLWYNSAGDWNTTYQGPKNRMLTAESRQKEFEWLEKTGIKGIKVDFFGGDGQSMIKYYIDILEDAEKHKLVVNFHGCTLPRGWQRTYPNLVSMEAVRGFENVTFDQEEADKQASLCCMLPFARNVFDPMDYTPMCFSEVPDKIRRTSNTFELALPFIFYSGITHFAEIPSGMADAPKYVRDLLVDLPVSWDESRLLDGFPGQYVVMANCKNGTWYISGINATDKDKEVSLKLPFVTAEEGLLITDGNNNRSFKQKIIKLDSSKTITLTMKPKAGFVLKLSKFHN